MLVAQLFDILYGSQLHHLLDQPIGVDEVPVQQLVGKGTHFAIELIGRAGIQHASVKEAASSDLQSL